MSAQTSGSRMEIKQYEERLQPLRGLRACTQTPTRARRPGEQKEDADGVRKEPRGPCCPQWGTGDGTTPGKRRETEASSLVAAVFCPADPCLGLFSLVGTVLGNVKIIITIKCYNTP